MSDTEIKSNAERFRADLSSQLSENIATIFSAHVQKLDEAYSRLTTLEAWRSFVLEQRLSSGAMGFFSEAQNDGLVSSVLISTGMWRPAMKSLRSLIENIVRCLYFMDHPVEYRQWDSGKFRISFRDHFEYLVSHPDIANMPEALNASAALRSHYSNLSNVVHASGSEFRMTSEIRNYNIWKTTPDGIGKWSTIQKNVIRDINLLMLPLFKSHLQGAACKGLREALSIVIPSSKDTIIKTSLGIKIIRK